ncbi:MAG: site-specific DNA-methyltransferase [bacterium]|nr:site-specific DNA-methyltransferase [bacterium]
MITMKKNSFINTDALSFLKKIEPNSVDLVLTDPPYIVSRKTGFKSIGSKSVERFAVNMDFGKWDNQSIPQHNKLIKQVIKEYFRVLKKSGTCIIWYDLFKIQTLKNFFESAGFSQIRFIEWVKTNPVPLNSKRNYLTNSREVALVAVKESKPTFNSEYDNGIYCGPIHRDGGGRIHPCQKPISITCQLIEKHSKPKDIVLDTFCGSATTLLCAKKTGRNYLGCEKDNKYFDLAVERLMKYDRI